MKFDLELRREALELVRAGLSAQEAACRLGMSASMVWRWCSLAGMKLQKGRLGGLGELRKKRDRSRRPKQVPAGPYVDDNGRLNQVGRSVIQTRLRESCTIRQIGRELGVAASTVSREVAARRVNGRYAAKVAHRQAMLARRRPREPKLAAGSWLRTEVAARLNAKQSPEQIAGRLKRDFPDRHDMWVSHETIYQALYVQAVGGLRHELTVEKALRQGRIRRRPRSKLPPKSGRSWIGDATFSARPAEVADRAVPGHWEGDLIIGGDDLRSALVTLNERHTRFTLIRRITVHDSITVTDRLIQMIQGLPGALCKSLTWDQGVEMADHARFSVATGCPVFFCDPHSPWQRPTNENGNGLVRDFFPKGTNFALIADEQVADAERLLNTRPRKVLKYATPAEMLDELLTVALTA